MIRVVLEELLVPHVVQNVPAVPEAEPLMAVTNDAIPGATLDLRYDLICFLLTAHLWLSLVTVEALVDHEITRLGAVDLVLRVLRDGSLDTSPLEVRLPPAEAYRIREPDVSL